MAWITRGPYGYQYRTIRRGGKVIRQYEAALPAADVPLLRQLQAVWRSRREVARLDWEDERRRLAEEESRVAGLDRAYDELATAALLAAGFHRPKRDRWRRRRAMANRIEAKVEDRPPLATRE